MTDYPADTGHRTVVARSGTGSGNRRTRPAWLTHGGLRELAQRTVADLNRLGIGRNDRVAIVLPNGPEMATRLRRHRLRRHHRAAQPGLQGRRVRLLPVRPERQGAGDPAGHGKPRARRAPRRAASRSSSSSPAGRPGRQHSLWHRRPACPAAGAGRPRPRRRTSRWCCTPPAPRRGRRSCRCGTSTSPRRPTTSASTLALTPDDVCLNIMPLFHIHGLIAATLASLAAGGGCLLHARLQRLPLLRLARRGAADLVHRRADHAPGHPRPRRPQRGDHPGRPAALHSLLLLVAAAAGDGDAGGSLRRAGDRGLRHDRSRAPDGVEPAAARHALSRLGRHRRRAGDRHHGRRRHTAAGRRARRGGDPRPQRHRRLREQPRRQREGLHQRLVPHRRSGHPRRGRAICA